MNRKDHWESIYKNESPQQVSWYQERPTTSLALIRKCSRKGVDAIIDVGGGASTLSDYLLKDGFTNVTVLDLSSNALAHARQRLGNKSASVKWVVNDVTAFVPPQQYDLWHDRAVFHFLNDKNDREKYKSVLSASINVGGYLVIAAFAIGGPTKCSGLDIVQYDAEKLQHELGESFLFLEHRQETHITPAGKEQTFGYYVFTRLV